MRFLRRIAGLFGFVKDDGTHEVKDQEDLQHPHDQHHHNQTRVPSNFQETGHPRKGFAVPVQVVVERSQPSPVLLPCHSGEGGVQGLRWYAKRMRVDEDGDVADEFLDEVLTETSGSADDSQKALQRFAVKSSTRPAKIKRQVVTRDGKFQQCMEHQGRLQWI